MASPFEILDGALADVEAKVAALEVALGVFHGGLSALEAQVHGVNEARIRAIEEFMAAHQAGSKRRQEEIDRLTVENQRLRQQMRTGRR